VSLATLRSFGNDAVKDFAPITIVGSTPEAYARQIAADVEKWKKVVAATGVKAE